MGKRFMAKTTPKGTAKHEGGSMEISPYARKFPRLAKSGKDDYGSMLNSYESTIKQVIAKLQQEPRLSLFCWAQLSSGGAQKACQGKGDASTHWGDSYTRLWRLPTYFYVGAPI